MIRTIARIDPWVRRTLALCGAVFYILLDLFEELTQDDSYTESGILAFHHWVEVFVVILVIWCLVAEIRLIKHTQSELEREQAKRRQLSQDLAGHIANRFKDWKFTQAETDIAWLLIKGFSFAEIAQLRGSKEKTLRQQASQIYAKSGVKGRTELAAAFLEDLIEESSPEPAR